MQNYHWVHEPAGVCSSVSLFKETRLLPGEAVKVVMSLHKQEKVRLKKLKHLCPKRKPGAASEMFQRHQSKQQEKCGGTGLVIEKWGKLWSLCWCLNPVWSAVWLLLWIISVSRPPSSSLTEQAVDSLSSPTYNLKIIPSPNTCIHFTFKVLILHYLVIESFSHYYLSVFLLFWL